MFFTKFGSLIKGMELSDPKADYNKARKLDRYRLGELAFYRPDGKYIPLTAVVDAYADKGSVHVTGCCIGNLPVDRVVVVTEQEKFPLMFDNKKNAEEAVNFLRSLL